MNKTGEPTDEQKPFRKGVFLGAYVSAELKESLQRRAAAENRTLSQEMTKILTEAVHGQNKLPGGIERRRADSPPRRRAEDPYPRRRAGDYDPHNDEDPSTGKAS
jgi:hypothetical protein